MADLTPEEAEEAKQAGKELKKKVRKLKEEELPVGPQPGDPDAENHPGGVSIEGNYE